MAFTTTHLKTISTKVDAKLHNLKHKIHKNKAYENTSEATDESRFVEKDPGTTNKPELTEEGRDTAVETNQTGVDAENIDPSIISQTNQSLENKAKREDRREARRAKWAARRVAFKTSAKKIAQALFLPAGIVLGVVLAPAIIALDIVLLVVSGVIFLVAKIVDFMCAPIMLCFMWK